MNKLKFIITRFTHGSAGKFLSTVLQTSDLVDHWSVPIQRYKQTKLFDSLVTEYVLRSFPVDHSQHLRSEPMVPYNTDLYSSGYTRGNNVTIEQYISNATIKNDTRLLDCIKLNLQINLIFHKPQLPVFCDGSNTVTITVTSQKEKNWLYNTLWSKHFLEKNGEIRYLPSDPSYCNFNSLVPVLTYNNQYLFTSAEKKKLFNDYIINNHTNSWYFDADKFKEYDSLHGLNNLFISLEEILSADKFLIVMQRIFKKFDLGTLNVDLVQHMHQIWLSRQFPYEI